MTPPGPSRGERFALAVDLGSSGAKVGLVSLTGAIARWTHAALETDYGPGGTATQDAERWWQIVVDSTRRCLANGPVSGAQVVAVCVTGQWASTVPVDAAGRPVGPCLMWSDTQGERYSRELVAGHLQGYRARALAGWVRRTAGVPTPSGADPIGHMLHLERDEPETARAARWYLEPVDYLSMRFTGVAAASHASMTAAWLTDNRHLDELAYDQVLVRRAGLDPAKLAPLVATGSVLATVDPRVASEIGISPEAVVVTGLPDLHSATVGSGCVRDYQPHLSIGTTSWISCPMPNKKTDLFRQMATVPGLSTDRYLLGNNQEAAGRCLQWFRDQVVGVADMLLPEASPGYDELTALAATAPPGSGGVLFTPWLAGERSPFDDHLARGGFHNLSLSSSRAHLTRAVLEGVAFNARWLLEGAEHFTGRRLEPIRMIGGGAQSLLWCQIVADVFDRTIERVAEPLLTGLRGTAIFAGLALGDLTHAEVRALVPVDAVLEPNPENRDLYDRLFAEFPGLYKAQRRMFSRLNG